jgi:hypothetical protein
VIVYSFPSSTGFLSLDPCSIMYNPFPALLDKPAPGRGKAYSCYPLFMSGCNGR